MNLRIVPDIIQQQTVFTLSRRDSVIDAARQMVEHHVAAIAVVDEKGRLVGIVTERDMTRRVIAKDLDAHTTTVGDIMTKDPDTLSPNDSALDALELMRMRNYRHLPVIDGDKLVGMISIRDLYAAVKGALEADIRETEAFVFGDRYGA